MSGTSRPLSTVFQLDFLCDYSIFHFPFCTSEESEVVQWEIRRINREELSLLAFWRNSPTFTPILGDQVVEVHKQWVVGNIARGVCAFSAQISCNSGQKMILTEFFSPEKDLQDQKFYSSENSGCHILFSDRCCFNFWRHVCREFHITMSGLIAIWELKFIISGDGRKSYQFVISRDTQKPFRNLAPRPSPIVRLCILWRFKRRPRMWINLTRITDW
jgi:hypothetical protein